MAVVYTVIRLVREQVILVRLEARPNEVPARYNLIAHLAAHHHPYQCKQYVLPLPPTGESDGLPFFPKPSARPC